jgi:hypothetical protein
MPQQIFALERNWGDKAHPHRQAVGWKLCHRARSNGGWLRRRGYGNSNILRHSEGGSPGSERTLAKGVPPNQRPCLNDLPVGGGIIGKTEKRFQN